MRFNKDWIKGAIIGIFFVVAIAAMAVQGIGPTKQWCQQHPDNKECIK